MTEHPGAQYLAEPAPDFDKVREELNRALANGATRFIPGRDEMRAFVAVFDLLSAEKARADAAEAERDGWQKIVGELAGAVPLPDIIKATGTTRDLIAYFKGVVRERDEARGALKPFAEAVDKYEAHYADETGGQPLKELDTDPVDMLGVLGDMFPMATFGDFRRARATLSQLEKQEGEK